LDVYIRPKTVVACIGYAPRTVKILKNQLFSIEEKICCKMVCNTLPLGWINHQQSRFEVKTHSKSLWQLKG